MTINCTEVLHTILFIIFQKDKFATCFNIIYSNKDIKECFSYSLLVYIKFQ